VVVELLEVLGDEGGLLLPDLRVDREQGVQVGVGEVQAVAVERVPGRQVPDRGLEPRPPGRPAVQPFSRSAVQPFSRSAVQPFHDPLQDASPAASSSCTLDGSSRTCPRMR
jgi:hypothetical protein